MSDQNPYTAPQTAIDSNNEENLYTPKVFSVRGRIGRLRFLAYSVLWTLVIWGILLVASIVIGILSVALSQGAAFVLTVILGAAFYILMLVPIFLLAVRRLNDMNVSGWLSLLIILLPLYPLFWLVLVFAPGTKGNNKFGPQPIANSVEVIVGAIAFPIGSAFVIGILAAVALPAYQDYTIRAQVSEALTQVGPVRDKVESYLQENQTFPNSNGDIDHNRRHSSPYIQTIDISAGGMIAVVLDSNNNAARGKTIILQPSIGGAGIQWDCTLGDLDTRYRPPGCRPQ